MKRILLYSLMGCLLSADTKIWNSHSAYLLPEKRIELGLFQPLRYGFSDNLEYSVYPLWFFVMPNISIKKPLNKIGNVNSAMRYGFVYPTPFLNMISKSGLGGVISPDFSMPTMVGISGSWLASFLFKGFDITFNSGMDIGIVLGDLDFRSSIDLPLVYHRLGIYYNNWGLKTGLDIQKNIGTNISILGDCDLRWLPGLDGSYSLEHKLLISWNKSDNFRLMTGYKFVMGEFPYGSDMRLLPYVPMAESWVPMIELQWARNRK